MKTLKTLALFALYGCAVPLIPYTSEFTVQTVTNSHNPYSQMPFSRPHRETHSVTLRNPTAQTVRAEVFCPGDIFEGHSYKKFTVRPGGEVHFLADVSSAAVESCRVTEWAPATETADE